MMDAIKTTCPYCGVGCGVLVTATPTGELNVKGDPEHPANFGRLCSKGAALAETLSLEGRLLAPEIDGQVVAMDTALDHVAREFIRLRDSYGTDSIAFYVSGQLLTEDYYLANKLMKGFIGSANIDTNSRLCMSSAVAGHKRAFGSDSVPGCYDDLERAKLITLAGSNTAWCHPVLYQRIVAAKKQNPDLMVVVIDPRRTATCDIADLHLPIKPGTDQTLFNGLLNFCEQSGERNHLYVSNFTEGVEEALKHARQSAGSIAAVAELCQLDHDLVERFYKLFARSERAVTLFSQGINQWSSGTDRVNAIINCHLLTGRIGRPGMGPFSITGQPNAMGGREVGGLANQLAAHMAIENPEHRALTQAFWQSPYIIESEGLKAVEMFEAIHAGKIKALWVMATNPAVSLPDATRVREALQKCELVVVSDCVRQTDTTQYADVLLPALTWGERSGSVTNSERCVSRQRAFLPTPGEAKPDWWMIAEVARRMGHAAQFNYASVHEIFSEHARLSGYENNGSRDFDISGLSELTAQEYEGLPPTQWPVTPQNMIGTARLFADGKFFTPSGKARFITTATWQAATPITSDYPLVLNTGRVRDHWHTMTRTGKAARLSQHIAEPFIELHPDDATRFGIQDKHLVEVSSTWGRAVVRAVISDAQQVGSVFIPIHWNNQFSASACVDELVNPAADPFSGQPEFKHTPVRIVPYAASWYGFILSRRKLGMQAFDYWTLVQDKSVWRYEIAAESLPAQWSVLVKAGLCQDENSEEWIEYSDKAQRRYRAACLREGKLEACIFTDASPDIIERDWLSQLFSDESLSQPQRNALLAGSLPGAVHDHGPIICSCYAIGLTTIQEAITSQGLTTVDAIGQALRAGTNCGSCKPELNRIIKEITE